MLKIFPVTITSFYQNARIVADTDRGVAAVVDPGGEIPQILEILRDNDLQCEQIWLTHSHLDHCGGVAELTRVTGAELFAHRADAYLRTRVAEDALGFGFEAGSFADCPEPDCYIDDGDQLTIGSFPFLVLHTPGHSPGHVAFWNEAEGVVISGDTIFGGTIGRSDLEGGNEAALLHSGRTKLLSLPPETILMCGHGSDTTVSAERATNPYFR